MSEDSEVKVQLYCPVTPAPEIPNSLENPPDDSIPPVIFHLYCASLATRFDGVSLVDFLALHIPLTSSLLDELISFGAIYARNSVRRSHEAPRPPRCSDSMPLLCSGLPLYVRVHAIPKRFRSKTPLRVLYEDEELYIVDKPAGLPVCATVDNIIENVCSLTETYVSHRLDVGTSGILVLGRRKESVGKINLALSNAEKRYKVLTRLRPPEGVMRHWFVKGARRGRGPLAGRIIADWSDDPPDEKGWVNAELVVEQVRKMTIPIGEDTAVFWESEIHLVTGRTHQIRLQLASFCVYGDSKFSELDSNHLLHDTHEKLGLSAVGLKLDWNGAELRIRNSPWWDRSSHDEGSSPV